MAKDPLRILHVFARLDSGGAETRTMEIYRNLNRDEIQFDFLSLYEDKQFYDEEINTLGGIKFVVSNPNTSGILHHFWDMYNIMKNEGPFHAVHAHTAHHEGIVVLAARLAGIKIRVCHARTTSTSNKTSLSKRIFFSVGRLLILLNATKLLAISKEAGSYLFGEKKVANKEVIVIPNAVDLLPYTKLVNINRMDTRYENNIPDNEILIGHVGRFNFMKNHIFLINLLDRIRSKGVDAHMVFVGGGELFNKYKKIIEDKGLSKNVTFLGVRRDIPQLMHMFDVFVMPSLYEGLGGAAIEAQAAGTPCLLSSTIPNAVDMGIGLVEFQSLDDNIESWVDKLIIQSKVNRPKNKEINEQFRKKGFLIDREIDMLMEAYSLRRV